MRQGKLSWSLPRSTAPTLPPAGLFGVACGGAMRDSCASISTFGVEGRLTGMMPSSVSFARSTWSTLSTPCWFSTSVYFFGGQKSLSRCPPSGRPMVNCRLACDPIHFGFACDPIRVDF